MPDPYDVLGRRYARHTEVSPYNAFYERPALLGLLGDQRDRDVLDLGVGPGPVAAALADQGARVTGLERSTAMLEVARERLGERVRLVRHDLADPLPLPDDGFDTVSAGLVLHYLPDWSGLLAEIARVLRPGGRLVASVHHPFTDVLIPTTGPPHGPYLTSYEVTDRWDLGDVVADVRFWHHPLGRMTTWVREAGLTLADMVEPLPATGMAERYPDDDRLLRERPAFLLLDVRRP